MAWVRDRDQSVQRLRSHPRAPLPTRRVSRLLPDGRVGYACTHGTALEHHPFNQIRLRNDVQFVCKGLVHAWPMNKKGHADVFTMRWDTCIASCVGTSISCGYQCTVTCVPNLVFHHCLHEMQPSNSSCQIFDVCVKVGR